MPDCEELVGFSLKGDDGGYSLYVTPLRLFDVPEVLEVQEVPFLTYWYVSGRIINLSN